VLQFSIRFQITPLLFFETLKYMSFSKTSVSAAPQQRISSFPANIGFALRVIVLVIITGVVMSVFRVSPGSIGQGLALALIGVGVYISFRVLNFPDLSVDGAFPMGGALAATLIVNYDLSAEITLPAAFVIGALVGLSTALIHILFKIEGLLASIIVMTGAYTVTLRIMGTSNIPLLNERTILTPYVDGMRDFLVNSFGDEYRRQAGNYVEIMIFLLVVIFVLFILNWFMHTEIGLTIRAAGKNSQMARSVGIHDRRMILVGLMISNGLSGLAGALAVQQLGFADVQMGVGMIVRGLAAVMIGEVLLSPRGIGQSIFAAVAGMIIFEVARAWVFAAFDLEASDIRLVSALVVLAALAAPVLWRQWRQRQRQNR
jgi:putative tryptophan/tyrosine transport system permease protein